MKVSTSKSFKEMNDDFLNEIVTGIIPFEAFTG